MPSPMTDPNDQRKFSNAMRLESEANIEAITQQMIDGGIDLAEWQKQMKNELRRANRQQFLIGRGGGSAEGITPGEYGKLGPELKRQYKYLRNFASVIEAANENESPLDFAIVRAKLYAKSTQAMFWKASVPVDIPQTPRDGKTQCRTNCKCRLRTKSEYDADGQLVAILVWWLMAPAEHCDDCKKLAREWNPLRLEVNGAEESSIRQSIAFLLQEADIHGGAAREIYAMWGIKEEIA